MKQTVGPDGGMWYASFDVPEFTRLTCKYGITKSFDVNYMRSCFFCLAHHKSVKGLEPGSTTRSVPQPGQGPVSYMTKASCVWSLNYGGSDQYEAERSISDACHGSSDCVLEFLHLVNSIERDGERMPLRPLLRADFADAVTTQCQVAMTPSLRREINHVKLCINLERIVDSHQGDDLLKGAAYEHCRYHDRRAEGRLWRLKNALVDDPLADTQKLQCISKIIENSL